MCPIAHVAHHPCAPSPQGTPPLSLILTMIPLCPCVPLPMCPVAHMSRKMSSCQKDVKLSKRCQMSKSQTHGLWRRFTKKINWHNEVHTYWCQFWHHIWWWPKTLQMCIESVFEQFWWPAKNSAIHWEHPPQHEPAQQGERRHQNIPVFLDIIHKPQTNIINVINRKCPQEFLWWKNQKNHFWWRQKLFDVKIDVNMCEPHYVNLFFLWTSSIVCVFDFLTFDIFLTFWHLFGILTSLWHLTSILT